MGGDGLFGMQAANGGPHIGIQKELWNPHVGFYTSSIAVHILCCRPSTFFVSYALVYKRVVMSKFSACSALFLSSTLCVACLSTDAFAYLTVLGTHFAATAAQKSQQKNRLFDFDSWS